MNHYKAHILERSPITEDIARVVLEAKGFVYEAGQYLVANIPGQENAYPFSMANGHNPNGHIELHIRHGQKQPDMEQWLHALDSVNMLEIVGPYGHLQLPMPQGKLVLVAGGTGIAPFRAICQHAEACNRLQDITLLWGINTSVDDYLHDELKAWQQACPAFQYHITRSQELRIDACFQTMLPTYLPWRDDTILSISGPWGMALAIFEIAMKAGIPKSHIHCDLPI